MKQIAINPNNEPYYSEDFIKGFKCGAERQFEADKSDADRPQGEWIEERANDADFISWHRWKCSVCGDWQTYGTPRYCPNCGADMRGDNDGKDIQSADE